MNDNLNNVLAELIKKLGEGAAKYGPTAIDMVGQYVHYQAIISLFIGFGLAILAFINAMVFLWLIRVRLKKPVDKYNDDYEETRLVCWIIGCLITGFLVLTSLIYLCDPSTWLAAIDSHMAIVKAVMDR